MPTFPSSAGARTLAAGDYQSSNLRPTAARETPTGDGQMTPKPGDTEDKVPEQQLKPNTGSVPQSRETVDLIDLRDRDPSNQSMSLCIINLCTYLEIALV